MANVLVINPPNTPFSPKVFLIEPVDALTLSSYIQSHGHQVDFLDMDAKRLRAADLPDKKYDYALLLYDYHIPLHHDETLSLLFEIASVLEKKGTVVAVCGKLATYRPETFIKSGSPFKVAMQHEAEISFLSLVNGQSLEQIAGIAFLDQIGDMVKTPNIGLFDLQSLPKLNYNLVDLKDYIDVRTILTSRGCCNHCSFCHVPGFWGKWRQKSAVQVVDEIENLILNYKSSKILFLDDNAMVSQKRMAEICRLIISRKLNVCLGCLGAVHTFDSDLMRLMYDAGFRWIHYGAESGSDSILKSIGKNQTAGEIRNVVTKSKEIGFRVRSSWIMDLPGSTLQDLHQTLSLIREILPDEIRLHYFSQRLGTNEMAETEDTPLQYIHSSFPLNNCSQIPSTQVVEEVEALLQYLQKKDYYILRNLADYEKISAEEWYQKGLKLVSLCPLRYGIGWQK